MPSFLPRWAKRRRPWSPSIPHALIPQLNNTVVINNLHCTYIVFQKFNFFFSAHFQCEPLSWAARQTSRSTFDSAHRWPRKVDAADFYTATRPVGTEAHRHSPDQPANRRHMQIFASVPAPPPCCGHFHAVSSRSIRNGAIPPHPPSPHPLPRDVI